MPRVALEPVDHLVYSKREFILKFVAAAAPTFNLVWKSTRTSTQADPYHFATWVATEIDDWIVSKNGSKTDDVELLIVFILRITGSFNGSASALVAAAALLYDDVITMHRKLL